tara:strand:- start:3376 stop:6567 length:3192 start_codon:yes stop_codon:yes gene_type:complete
MSENDSPKYSSPDENSKSSEKTTRSSGPTPESLGKKKEELVKYIRDNQNDEKAKRQLAVLEHKTAIRKEQQDYISSIEGADNRDELYDKLFKIDEHVDKYSEKFIEGKISGAEFSDRGKQTIIKLRDFLEMLPKVISLDSHVKKLLKAKKTGAIPKAKAVPTVTRPVTKEEIKKQPRKNWVRTKPVKGGTVAIDTAYDKPTIGSPSKSDSSKKPSPKKVKIMRERPRLKITQKDNKFKVPLQKPAPVGTGYNVKTRKWLLKPMKNIDTISDKEALRLKKQLKLKWPPGLISKEQEPKIARRLLKDYYRKQSPGRKVELAVPKKSVRAMWNPPMSTDGIIFDKAGNPTRATSSPEGDKKKTVKFLPPRWKKTKRAPKAAPQNYRRKPVSSNDFYDPYHANLTVLKKINGKIRPAQRSPGLRTIYIPNKNELYDPRPSWDWVPEDKDIAKSYDKKKKELLKNISAISSGNQFLLAQTIQYSHRMLQTWRAQAQDFKKTRKFSPLKMKKTAAKFMKGVEGSVLMYGPKNKSPEKIFKKEPLLIPVSGQIRPGGKKAPGKRKFKRVPVEVLSIEIPKYYSRVDTLLAPPSEKDEVKKFRKPIKKEFVLRSPNWNEVPATGFKSKVKGVTYIDVTPEDLETYLAQTYLAGYLNNVHGMPINISDVDRRYAWENAIDLRETRGTSFEKEGLFVITRADLEKAKNKVVGGPGTTDTAEEKAVEMAYSISRELYSIYQKHKPKTELKKFGKQKIAVTVTHMTMEQYNDALKGKGKEGLPMTSEQIAKTIEKVQSQLKKLISMESALKSEGAKEKVSKYIFQITKFIEDMKKGKPRSPARIKRKGPAKKRKGAAQFLRTGGKKGKGSPSTSSSSSSSKPKTPPKPVKLKIPPRKMNAEETVILNHFETLDLDPTATGTQITKAYRKLAMKVHPDKNPSPTAQGKFVKIKSSYDFLKDPTVKTKQLMEKLATETRLYNENRTPTPPKPKSPSKSPSKSSSKGSAKDSYSSLSDFAAELERELENKKGPAKSKPQTESILEMIKRLESQKREMERAGVTMPRAGAVPVDVSKPI